MRRVGEARYRPGVTFVPGEVTVVCTDAAESLWFYETVLGAEVVALEGITYRLMLGDQIIVLFPIADEAAPADGYGTRAEMSLTLVVEDIEAAHTYLVSHGVTVVTEWEPGERSFVIRDPDGVAFDVVEGPPIPKG